PCSYRRGRRGASRSLWSRSRHSVCFAHRARRYSTIRRMEDHAKTHTLLARAEAFARSRLSERRYEHTLRVADTAESLALAHDLEADRARLSALLHDAARETGPEEFLKLADKWHLQVGDPERQSPKLLHGPVAAELARRELGIGDEGVLNGARAP